MLIVDVTSDIISMGNRLGSIVGTEIVNAGVMPSVPRVSVIDTALFHDTG